MRLFMLEWKRRICAHRGCCCFYSRESDKGWHVLRPQSKPPGLATLRGRAHTICVCVRVLSGCSEAPSGASLYASVPWQGVWKGLLWGEKIWRDAQYHSLEHVHFSLLPFWCCLIRQLQQPISGNNVMSLEFQLKHISQGFLHKSYIENDKNSSISFSHALK